MAHLHIGKLIINAGIAGLLLTFVLLLFSIPRSNNRSKLPAAILVGQAVVVLTALLLRMNKVISAQTMRLTFLVALAGMVILVAIVKSSRKATNDKAA
jgi:hypothetical protein